MKKTHMHKKTHESGYSTLTSIIVVLVAAVLFTSLYFKFGKVNQDSSKITQNSTPIFPGSYYKNFFKNNFNINFDSSNPIADSMNCQEKRLGEIDNKDKKWGVLCNSTTQNNMYMIAGWKRNDFNHYKNQVEMAGGLLYNQDIKESSKVTCTNDKEFNANNKSGMLVNCSLVSLKQPINFSVYYFNNNTEKGIMNFILVSDYKASKAKDVIAIAKDTVRGIGSNTNKIVSFLSQIIATAHAQAGGDAGAGDGTGTGSDADADADSGTMGRDCVPGEPFCETAAPTCPTGQTLVTTTEYSCQFNTDREAIVYIPWSTTQPSCTQYAGYDANGMYTRNSYTCTTSGTAPSVNINFQIQ